MNKVKQFNRKHQQGVSMVEMTLTIMIMLVLVLAIIEFSLAMFMWSRGVEATRLGARFASVNSPVVSLSSLDCTNSNSRVQQICNDTCEPLISKMQTVLPEIAAENVRVTYECTRTGNPERPIEMVIPEIKIELIDMQYTFLTPQILGVESTIAMPAFMSNHTGEDLFTVGAGGGDE